MTMEAKTQGILDLAGDIPEDSVAEINKGYAARLAALSEAAEEEGIEWSVTSEQDFRAFVAGNPGWRKGRRCPHGQRQSARHLG